MAVKDPLGRTRSILDPIHGLIRLTETEMAVVDSPLFQRLQCIRQNGLLYRVFPAATHTRFEHSLGALFVAHGMLNSLALNSTVGLTKGNVRQRRRAKAGEAVSFPDSEAKEWSFLYEVTRLAALTHDIGHGPLSHTFDAFSPSRDDLNLVLKSKELKALVPLHDFILNWGTDWTKGPRHKKNRRVPHEIVSCLFFTKIWHDLRGDPETALAVCASILGEHAGVSAASLLRSRIARAWVPLIHDIVASAPADADRMDYLERDSRAIGVTYGLFDRNRVLKSLLCYRDQNANEPAYRLGVKYSGLQAIENLMQARYELFAQVYYHKTNRAISRMLDAIGSIADKEMNLFGKNSTLESWIWLYLEFSDERFFHSLLGKRAVDTPQTIRSLAEQIHNRHFWKRILDPTMKGEAKNILLKLRKKFPRWRNKIVLDDTKPRALKDLNRGARLLSRHGAAAYEVGKVGTWTRVSTIIQALDKADRRSVRIYFEDTDAVTAKQIREYALELAFDR